MRLDPDDLGKEYENGLCDSMFIFSISGERSVSFCLPSLCCWDIFDLPNQQESQREAHGVFDYYL